MGWQPRQWILDKNSPGGGSQCPIILAFAFENCYSDFTENLIPQYSVHVRQKEGTLGKEVKG